MEAPLDHIPFIGRVVARWWPERIVADHFTVPPYRERLSSDRVLCCRTVRFRRRSSSFGANWDCGKIAFAIRGSASSVTNAPNPACAANGNCEMFVSLYKGSGL